MIQGGAISFWEKQEQYQRDLPSPIIKYWKKMTQWATAHFKSCFQPPGKGSLIKSAICFGRDTVRSALSLQMDHLRSSPRFYICKHHKSDWCPLFVIAAYRVLCVGRELLPLPQPADHWFWISLGRAAEQSASPFLRLHILRRRGCKWRRGCDEKKTEGETGVAQLVRQRKRWRSSELLNEGLKSHWAVFFFYL